MPKGAKALILDYVLATGGTILAANEPVKNAGFEIGVALTLLEI